MPREPKQHWKLFTLEGKPTDWQTILRRNDYIVRRRERARRWAHAQEYAGSIAKSRSITITEAGRAYLASMRAETMA